MVVFHPLAGQSSWCFVHLLRGGFLGAAWIGNGVCLLRNCCWSGLWRGLDWSALRGLYTLLCTMLLDVFHMCCWRVVLLVLLVVALAADTVGPAATATAAVTGITIDQSFLSCLPRVPVLLLGRFAVLLGLLLLLLLLLVLHLPLLRLLGLLFAIVALITSLLLSQFLRLGFLLLFLSTTRAATICSKH